jgi:glycine/D-amino acid oxidase-like deaminating enzyme
MAETYYVAIVAGGIIGACLAFGLVRRGARVVVLDQGRVGGGTTGATLAWINATAKADDPAYYRLNAEGVAAWRGLAAELGAEAIGYGGEGAVFWAEGASAALDADRVRLRALGHDFESVDARAIAGLAPGIRVAPEARGFRATADRWVDAPRAVAALSRRIRASGSSVMEDTRVASIRLDRTGAALATNAGMIAADRVAVAGGPATQELVACAAGPEAAAFVPVDQDPGLLVDTPPLPAAADLRVHLFPPGASGLHLRAFAGGFRMGSDAGDATVRTRPGQLDASGAVAAMVAEAVRLYPDLAAGGLAAACAWRVGIRAVPRDGVTIAGPVPGADRLWAVVTHSGVTLAPLLGELVAAELLGAPPSPLLAPYRPTRFART